MVSHEKLGEFMKKLLIGLLLLFCSYTVFGQDYFPQNGSVKEENTNYMAFTNATLFITPTKVVKKGTLLIQNGKVEQG